MTGAMDCVLKANDTFQSPLCTGATASTGQFLLARKKNKSKRARERENEGNEYRFKYVHVSHRIEIEIDEYERCR